MATFESEASIDEQIRRLQEKKSAMKAGTYKPSQEEIRVRGECDINKKLKKTESALRKLSSNEKSVQDQKDDLIKQKVNLLRQRYPRVYGLVARCKNNSHVVTYFADEASARHYEGSSTDFDNGNEWYYSVKSESSSEVSDSEMADLGKVPSHFPYMGY